MGKTKSGMDLLIDPDGNVGIGFGILSVLALPYHIPQAKLQVIGSAMIGADNNIVTGANAIAVGEENKAMGKNSVAMGSHNEANGAYSVALG